jgi:hypothetical protein
MENAQRMSILKHAYDYEYAHRNIYSYMHPKQNNMSKASLSNQNKCEKQKYKKSPHRYIQNKKMMKMKWDRIAIPYPELSLNNTIITNILDNLIVVHNRVIYCVINLIVINI